MFYWYFDVYKFLKMFYWYFDVYKFLKMFYWYFDVTKFFKHFYWIFIIDCIILYWGFSQFDLRLIYRRGSNRSNWPGVYGVL